MTGILERLMQKEKDKDKEAQELEEVPEIEEIDPAADIDKHLDEMKVIIWDDIEAEAEIKLNFTEEAEDPAPKIAPPIDEWFVYDDMLRSPVLVDAVWTPDDGPLPFIWENKPRGGRALYACKWICWQPETQRVKIYEPRDWFAFYPGDDTCFSGEIPDGYIWWALQDYLVLIPNQLTIQQAVFIFDYNPDHTGQAAEARKLYQRLVISAPEFLWKLAVPPQEMLKGSARYRPGW